MKKIIFLKLFFTNLLVFSQKTIRIYYQVLSKTAVKQDTLDKDVYVLDIIPPANKSLFYNFTYLRADSTYAALKKELDFSGGVNFDESAMAYSNFNIGVRKNNDNYEIIQIFDGDSYKYNGGKEIKWFGYTNLVSS